MNNTVIVYASVHHKNTEKIIESIKGDILADTVDLTKDPLPDITGYKNVIIASGIYFNKMHKAVIRFVNDASYDGKNIIILFSCGLKYFDFSRRAKNTVIKRGGNYLGSTYSRGYDTFGPFKLIGGIAKNHPNQNDIDRIKRYIKENLSL